MYTSVLCLALASCSSAPSSAAIPIWLENYQIAQERAALVKKPLAVFFGAGAEGQNSWSREGTMGSAVRAALAKDYVCVYVDVDSEGGQKLASDFGISKQRGLVISDRSGVYQAFHYNGAFPDDVLNRCLQRFADPAYVYRATSTDPYERPGSSSLFSESAVPGVRGAPVTRNC